MDDIELLDWRFRIAKMGRSELEATVELMADSAEKPFSVHDRDAMDRLERIALIYNIKAMLNRPLSADSGSRKGKSKRTATVDLGAYYDALSVQDDEARERADRAEIRAMCEHRLSHMEHRDRLRYTAEPSPLKVFIEAHAR